MPAPGCPGWRASGRDPPRPAAYFALSNPTFLIETLPSILHVDRNGAAATGDLLQRVAA